MTSDLADWIRDWDAGAGAGFGVGEGAAGVQRIFDLQVGERKDRDCEERSLGAEIILCAIYDYRRASGDALNSARYFLYSDLPEWVAHRAWALGLAPGLDAGWLRERLDGHRGRWDREREARAARKRGQTARGKMRLPAPRYRAAHSAP